MTKLQTSTHTKEVFDLPDLMSRDRLLKGPWDFPFFEHEVKVVPLVICKLQFAILRHVVCPMQCIVNHNFSRIEF